MNAPDRYIVSALLTRLAVMEKALGGIASCATTCECCAMHRRLAERALANAASGNPALLLLEALRPFAALMASHHADIPDDSPVFGVNDHAFTHGDLRRAAAAVAVFDGAA